MNVHIVQSSPPSLEPVTLTEAKSHCRVDIVEDDVLIGRLITAAREYVEATIKRQLITATWKLYLDSFPEEIILPRPPLSSVTSITYVDTNGATQTVSASVYQVTTADEPARIVTAYGQSWPTARTQPDAVCVTYVAGYASTASSAVAACPVAIKQAMLLIIGHLYEFRQTSVAGTIISQVPFAVDALLAPYKIAEVW